MAEAVGAIGTAVGVVSLGIQVCHGLITYFPAYKDQGDVIRKVYLQVVSLKTTLDTSKDILDSLSQDHAPVVKQVQRLVLDCRSSVEALGMKSSSLTSSRCLTLLNNIDSLLPKVDGISLKITSASNQIDKTLSSVEEVRQSASTTAAALPHIQQTLTQTSQSYTDLDTQLVLRHKDVSQAIDLLPGRLQHALIPAFESHRQQLASQEVLLLNLSSQVSRLPLIEDLRAYATHPPRPPKNRSKDSRDTFSACSCGLNVSRWEYQARGVSLRFWQHSRSRKVHRRDCAIYEPLKRTELGIMYHGRLFSGTVAFSVAVQRGLGAFAISPNIMFRATVSYEAPAFALLLRAISDVRPNRPDTNAEILQDTSKQLEQLYQDRLFHPRDVDDSGKCIYHYGCHLAVSVLYYCSRSTASVELAKALLLRIQSYNVPLNDVGLDGKSGLDILSTSLQPRSVFTNTGNISSADTQLVYEIMLSGAEFSQDAEHLLSRIHQSQIDALIVQKFWSSSELTEALKLGPLSRAIVAKDENLARRYLIKSKTYLQERSTLDQSPLHLAANWPTGTHLVLSHGGIDLAHVVDCNQVLPLYYALWAQASECVGLILEADSPLFAPRGWGFYHGNVFSFALHCHLAPEIIRCLVLHTADRRRRLQKLALEVDPAIWRGPSLPDPNSRLLNAGAWEVYHHLINLNIPVPTSLQPPNNSDVYCSLVGVVTTDTDGADLVEYAQMFWDAGFVDVDCNDGRGTHLMAKWFAAYFEYYEYSYTVVGLGPLFTLCLWLVEKGASTSRLYAKHGRGFEVPASHWVGRDLIKYDAYHGIWLNSNASNSTRGLLPSERPSAERFVTLILQESTCDECDCACSDNGCTALLQTLKESFWNRTRLEVKTIEHPVAAARRDNLYCWRKIAECLDGEALDIYHSSVIKFETFTAMGLTHTCCAFDGTFINDGYFVPFEQDDRVEIQDEESEDIQKLEELTAEFIDHFRNSDLHITEFLRGYWQERMSVVMQWGTKPDVEVTEAMRELGIVLDQSMAE